MKQIFNWLWIGDYEDLTEQAFLMRVLYVGSNKLPLKFRKEVTHIELLDDSTSQKEKVQKAIDELIHLFREGCEVLICCDAGFSRSPYIVARFIDQLLSSGIDTAYEMLQSIYPLCDERTPLRVNDR